MGAWRFGMVCAGIVSMAVVAGVGCSGPPPPPESAPVAESEGGPGATAAPAPAVAASRVPEALSSFGLDVTPETGDFHLMRIPAEPPHLNPLTSSDYYATTVLTYIFDALLYRNPETLEMEPRLAERWEESEDHLSYTFYLRKDATFSDGEPVTAEDVKFTYDRLMDPAVDAPHLRNYFKDVVSCEIIDEHTVRYTCSQPYYRHLVMIGGIEVLPKHIYGEGNFNDHPNNRRPIGSGMYRLATWETGRQIVLERNENYWWDEYPGPWFDRVIFRVLTDDTVAYQMLERGDIDTMAVRAEDWVLKSNNPSFNNRLNRFTYFRPQYSYIGWNQRRPMFADKRVRTAMTMLLDRETILREIYYGLGRVVAGNFMPDTPEHNDSIEALPFDPAAAVTLLEEAGWRDSNGNGTRDKDGQEFRFEVLITNQNVVAEKILTVYKEELARVGIELIIRPLEWAGMLERVDKREFDASLMGWSMPPDPDPYQVWHSSQTEAGSNYIGFVNEEADKLIEDARTSFDHDERIRMYHRFQEIVHDEQPYTFCFSNMTLLAVDKRIHGVEIFPFGIEEPRWFVPSDMQRHGQ